jgi:hypothetical protein
MIGLFNRMQILADYGRNPFWQRGIDRIRRWT